MRGLRRKAERAQNQKSGQRPLATRWGIFFFLFLVGGGVALFPYGLLVAFGVPRYIVVGLLLLIVLYIASTKSGLISGKKKRRKKSRTHLAYAMYENATKWSPGRRL